MSIYGDGTQTRSFGYVDDTVDGLLRLLDSDVQMPVNLGTPTEFSILELVEAVRQVTGTTAEVVHLELPTDDPTQRQPDIGRAKELLGWKPEVTLIDGHEFDVSLIDHEHRFHPERIADATKERSLRQRAAEVLRLQRRAVYVHSKRPLRILRRVGPHPHRIPACLHNGRFAGHHGVRDVRIGVRRAKSRPQIALDVCLPPPRTFEILYLQQHLRTECRRRRTRHCQTKKRRSPARIHNHSSLSCFRGSTRQTAAHGSLFPRSEQNARPKAAHRSGYQPHGTDGNNGTYETYRTDKPHKTSARLLHLKTAPENPDNQPTTALKRPSAHFYRPGHTTQG